MTEPNRSQRLLSDAIARLPPAVARIVAQALARSRTLEREPGWKFDMSAGQPATMSRIKRDLWTYYRQHGIDVPVTFRWYDDLRVRVFLGNDMSLCLYVGGSFEPNEFAFLRSVLRPGMTVIDGGANEGLYSLFAARRVGLSGTVLAIEPSTREYERLLANLALNSLQRVVALKVALGRTAGSALLAVAEAGHEGQNTVGSRVSNPKVATVDHEEVNLTTIDAIVGQRRLDRVDLIKLDIEGSEVDALEGAHTTIDRFKPLLLLEAEDERLAGQGRTKDEFRRVVESYGYRLWVFDASTADLRAAVAPAEPEGNVVAAPADWIPPQPR